MLGPPNATTNRMLSTSDPHHVFTLHRRFALSCMALLWGLIGAFLGLKMNGPIVVILSSGIVASSYWVLRTGELAARAGELSPVLAAWSPVLVMTTILAIIWRASYQ